MSPSCLFLVILSVAFVITEAQTTMPATKPAIQQGNKTDLLEKNNTHLFKFE